MSYLAPEDKQITKYFLQFNNEADGVFEIDMPIGFDKMKMKMKTNSEGFGKYLEFSDELDVVFVREFNYQFEFLRSYVKKYAWHTDIDFFMQIEGVNFIEGKLDFESSFKTDYSNEIKCKLIFENLRKKIESKKSTPIELNSNKAIDNKTEITPISQVGLLTKFKAILTTSDFQNEINQTGEVYAYMEFSTGSIILPLNRYRVAVCGFFGKSLIKNINETLNFNYTYNNQQVCILNKDKWVSIGDVWGVDVFSEEWESLRFSQSVDLQINLKKVFCSCDYNDSLAGWNFKFVIIHNQYNSDFNSIISKHILFQFNYNQGGPATRLKIEIENILLNYSLPSWSAISFTVYSFHEKEAYEHTMIHKIYFDKSSIIEVGAVNKFDNTTTKSVKLIDVGEQIIKSITGGNSISNFDAPRFKTLFNENKINFYDLYVTSGLYLRGFNNEKFTSKWNDWVNFIRKALNSDYQIYNNKIFVRHYKDFRNDLEIARFEFEIDTENYEVTFNERLIKSNFKIGYKKYQDDEQNTKNSIHQEAEFLVVDSNLTDETLDYSIDYICDAYKIEYTRRESFTKDSTKATPNDKDIYVIDTHNNNGILENRTNQGVEYAYNIFSPETYYNLRLSIKRLLYDYFSNFLAEISQYNYENTPIINVDYKPNKDATIKYNSNFEFAKEKETIEAGNFNVTDLENPLVTGQVYEFTLLKRFEFVEFLELVKEIMETGGYLTFFSETKEINIFPTELDFEWELNKLKVKGEEKWTLIS